MAEPAARPVVAGDRYPQLLRTEQARWWRSLLGLLLAGSVLVVAGVALTAAAYLLAVATGQTDESFSDGQLVASSPIGLLATNLVLAVMIPASVLAVLVVHRGHPGWLAAVTGRPRWGLLGRLLAVAAVVVLAFVGVSFLLPSSSDLEVSTASAQTLVALLAVVLLTTPLQACAEEVGFRGYLSQAVASCFARPVVGSVVAAAVSSVLFALAHGLQDAWLFGDRLAFGLVASWLAWRTGGLEAPVALHVANNLVSLVAAVTTGTLDESLTASTLEWQSAVLDVTMMLTFALVVERLVRRRDLVVRRAPHPPAAPSAVPPGSSGILSGPGAVGYPGPRPPTPPQAGGEQPWGMG